MKSVRQQIEAMRRHWPNFEVAAFGNDHALWFGALAGVELQYRIMIQFGLPDPRRMDNCQWRRFPLVRVLSPSLRPNWDAKDEAPLPHVYFENTDISLSPLAGR